MKKNKNYLDCKGKKENKIIVILNKIPTLIILIILSFILFLYFACHIFFDSNYINFIIVYLSNIFLVLSLVKLFINKYNNLIKITYYVLIILTSIYLYFIIAEFYYNYTGYYKVVSTYKINTKEKLEIQQGKDNNYILYYSTRVRKHLIYKIIIKNDIKETNKELRNIEDIYYDLEKICPNIGFEEEDNKILKNAKKLNLFE